MTVKELISELKDYDQGLTVCLGDWQEEHFLPSAAAVNDIQAVNAKYTDENWKTVTGKFLQIGNGK